MRHLCTKNRGSIEARIAWALLWAGTGGVLEEPTGEDYAGMLEGMEARELLALMEQVQERLQALGAASSGNGPGARSPKKTDSKVRNALVLRPLEHVSGAEPPVKLYIDCRYAIRMNAPDGPEMPLRPLVKALFILFLKHPEGIRLKERERHQSELEEIYGTIAPGVSQEDVRRRVQRLVDPEDNSFSEKASVLNTRLEALLPPDMADGYKIQGFNGHPRRIPLAELMVEWV